MATEVGSLQASLSLDISNFSRSMQAAVSMVQQLGRQLQAALGNTQGFSALQRSTAELKAEIESVIASIKNMQAVLGNTQNATAIFTAIRQHTSGLSGDFDKIHIALQEIISLLQQLNGAAAGVASSTRQMASNINAFNAASQAANRQARQTSTNSRQASSAIRNASTQASRLANNLQKGAGFAANLKHIVEGIVISQAFYKMLNIMQDLVSESFQFMNNMAQTEIAFKYLLGSEEDAKSMLESLQDLSITSPISTADATEMSRKLMAMGFSAKSVIPTLKILTDTAAVFTNEAGEMNDMMSHVVVALGQMKSAGTVSMQELRQLYNAGIPIFQILQDGLGLTAAQVRNIGKLGVDSGTAILAVLNELQKKWVKGEISNYDYLFEVNLFASRSFQILNQYPIYPWVICKFGKDFRMNDINSYRDLTIPIALHSQKVKKQLEKDIKDKGYNYSCYISSGSLVYRYFFRLQPYSNLLYKEMNEKCFAMGGGLFNDFESFWNTCI